MTPKKYYVSFETTREKHQILKMYAEAQGKTEKQVVTEIIDLFIVSLLEDMNNTAEKILKQEGYL